MSARGWVNRSGPAARRALAACLLLSAAAARGREVRLTILHTADVRGRLLGAGEGSEGRAGGGLLRAAVAVRALRAGDDPVLLFDCGNLFSGAPESDLAEGRTILAVVRGMAYDARVPGDGEWDGGEEQAARLRAEAGIPVVAADCRAPHLEPYRLLSVAGLRIAVTGLTLPGMPLRHPPGILEPARFEDPFAALAGVIERLRLERPHLIVLLAHQGLGFQDGPDSILRRVTRDFPEIDLVLGGHTGTLEPGRRAGNAWFAQAGSQAFHLGRIDLLYDTVAGRLRDVRGRLMPLGAGRPPDEALLQTLEPDLENALAAGRRVIGHLEKPLGKRALAALAAEAAAGAAGAEAALVRLEEAAALPAGPITLADLWSVWPRTRALYSLLLTPRELRAILEEFPPAEVSGGLLGCWGVLPAGGGNWEVTAEAARHGHRLIPVALDAFLLSSDAGRRPALRAAALDPRARLSPVGTDARAALAAWIAEPRPPPRAALPDPPPNATGPAAP